MGERIGRWIAAGQASTNHEIDGWLVERKAVSQEAVVAVPDSLSYEEASTLPRAGLGGIDRRRSDLRRPHRARSGDGRGTCRLIPVPGYSPGDGAKSLRSMVSAIA